MQTCAVLRDERERRNLTQAQVSQRVYMHESTIRGYESETREIPPATAGRLARILRSPRLALTYCHNCPANLLVPPYLFHVDHHPLAVLDAILCEAQEASAAVQSLHLRNRVRPDDLTMAERQQLERAVDQVLDLIPAAETFVTAVAEVFGLDPWTLHERNHEKLIRRGYTGGDDDALDSPA